MELNVGDLIGLRDFPLTRFLGEVTYVSGDGEVAVFWKIHGGTSPITIKYSIDQIGDGISSGKYFYRSYLAIILSKEEQVIKKAVYLRDKWRKKMQLKGKHYAKV